VGLLWAWARRLLGNGTALAAAAPFTTLPPVLAHAGLATTDRRSRPPSSWPSTPSAGDSESPINIYQEIRTATPPLSDAGKIGVAVEGVSEKDTA